MVEKAKKRVVIWDVYSSPAGSTKPDPFLAGKIECYIVLLGKENGRVKFDLGKVDPAFGKLTDFGKQVFSHGVKQKAVDKCAGKSPAEAYELITEVRDNLESQVWTSKRESAVARGLNDLASAMAFVKFGESFTEANRDTALEKIAAADKEKIGAWRKNARVAARIADIELVRANTKRAELAKVAKESEVDFTF